MAAGRQLARSGARILAACLSAAVLTAPLLPSRAFAETARGKAAAKAAAAKKANKKEEKQKKEKNPAPSADKGFFGTTAGRVALVVMAAGTGYMVYSAFKDNDPVKSVFR